MQNPRGRMGTLGAAVAIALVSLIALEQGRWVLAAGKSVRAATVRLTVDYHDGVQKVFVFPWTKGMTVLQAMKLAQSNPHGLTFTQSGSGSTAFISKIDDVQNERGGSGKKNWLFWVNDQLSDRSAGVYELQTGDAVVWKFDTYPPKPGESEK